MANTKVKAEQLEAAQTNITSLGTLTALTVDDITIDGSTISDGGDLTVDVAGEINLDADGGKIRFKDGGTEHLRFVMDNAGVVQLYSAVQDADIKIQGNDGGSVIDALVLDMSEAGAATFNGELIAPNGATEGYHIKTVGGTATPRITNDGNNWTILRPGASGADVAINNYANSANLVVFTDEGNVSIGNLSVAFPSGEGLQVYSSGNPRIKLANSTTGVASGDGTQFYLDGADVIYDNKDAGNQRWYTGGAERVRIDSTGIATFKPGIGDLSIKNNDSSPQSGIILEGVDANHAIYFRRGRDGTLNTMDFHEYDQFRFFTGGAIASQTERMRIDSNGNVGIGRTPSSVTLDIQDESSSTLTGLRIRNRGAVAGSAVKAIWSLNRDGSDIDFEAGSILVGKEQNWTTSASTVDSYMAFRTTQNESVYERMRITSGGLWFLGKTASSLANTGVEIHPSGIVYATSTDTAQAYYNRENSHGVQLQGRKDNSNVWSISSNGSSLASDRNFKKDIADLQLGLDFVKKLKPKTFRFKMDKETDPLMTGLIAQDLEQSLTDAGVEKNSMTLVQNEPQEDESESQYMVDYSKLIPVLIKGMQEQQTLIETLQAEVAALKGG